MLQSCGGWMLPRRLLTNIQARTPTDAHAALVFCSIISAIPRDRAASFEHPKHIFCHRDGRPQNCLQCKYFLLILQQTILFPFPQVAQIFLLKRSRTKLKWGGRMGKYSIETETSGGNGHQARLPAPSLPPSSPRASQRAPF